MQLEELHPQLQVQAHAPPTSSLRSSRSSISSKSISIMIYLLSSLLASPLLPPTRCKRRCNSCTNTNTNSHNPNCREIRGFPVTLWSKNLRRFQVHDPCVFAPYFPHYYFSYAQATQHVEVQPQLHVHAHTPPTSSLRSSRSSIMRSSTMDSRTRLCSNLLTCFRFRVADHFRDVILYLGETELTRRSATHVPTFIHQISPRILTYGSSSRCGQDDA